MYLRRTGTNFRVLSKTTAQGSLPCGKKPLTMQALPTTSGTGMNAASAPIDVAAFGKRLGEIITKAVRASRKRPKASAVNLKFLSFVRRTLVGVMVAPPRAAGARLWLKRILYSSHRKFRHATPYTTKKIDYAAIAGDDHAYGLCSW
jgi:hypothetical protein